uniref:Myb/SANT-like DNA-binding domain-containing protein n=1 Tax=Eptatretus burgeri TaxID=7764 RepID=A0A8C4QWG6_EPTBU
MAPKKHRKSNFSDREIRCLLFEIASVKTDLLSRDQFAATNQEKSSIWEAITDKVNLCNGGVFERTERGVKSKWNQLKCQATKMLKEHQRTGAPLSTKEFPHLELVLSVVGNHSNGTHGGEVAGKDRFDTQWNCSTPGISTDGPLDESIQERDVTMKPAVARTVCTPLDVAASSAMVPKLTEDFDISWLSSVSKHYLACSNVGNGSERKGRKWQLVITPETDEEIVLFKQWMMSTIEKNIAKKKLLEAQKSKAILEVEKLKSDLGMWES